MNGYIKLHRKLTEWGWYSDSAVKSVFLHIMLTATFRNTTYKGHELKPGQAIIGRKRLAMDLGLSEQQVRTALKKLESTGEISVFSTNKFSVITVENWEFYQDDEGCEQPTNNQQITNNQPHLKKVKNVKKVKNNIYTRYGEFENVSLSEEELEKLKERFPYDWQARIENLSQYMQSKGKRYKSHYATILAWSRREEPKTVKEERKLDWTFPEELRGIDG